MVQTLLRKVNTGSLCTSPKPLDEVSARTKTYFQHAFIAVTGELRKRMNKRLIKITMGFKLLKVLAGEFWRYGIFGPAALVIPKFTHLLLQGLRRWTGAILRRHSSRHRFGSSHKTAVSIIPLRTLRRKAKSLICCILTTFSPAEIHSSISPPTAPSSAPATPEARPSVRPSRRWSFGR